VRGNTSWEPYPCGPPAHLAATCALPTSTTVTAVILSSAQDEPQSIRLATCLDRSVAASGAIASMVSPRLPWRKLLLPAERLALRGQRPGDGRGQAAPASGGSAAVCSKPPGVVAEDLPPALDERPRRRAAHRQERAVERGLSPSGERWVGLGEPSKAGHRRSAGVERQGRAGRRSGPGRQRASWGTTYQQPP
jgi:hypothetical protein